MNDERGTLIRSGDVYDGTGATAHSGTDVRIRGGIIAEIGRNLVQDGEEVIDANGLIVCPGLIDLHVHVFSGVGIYAIDPPRAGLAHGVTTMLDTGTAGSLTYDAFERFVIRPAREDIFALLNITQIGVIQGHPDVPPFIGDLNEIRHAHVPSAVECIRRFPERIIGTKVRLTSALGNYREENERAGLVGAVEAARQTDRPCMVHHAMSKIPLKDVLGALRPGDIYTHCFHPYEDNGFGGPAGGPPLPEVIDARRRGVVFDVGHGLGAFAWRIAEAACCEHGFWPDTISTDLHAFNLNGPVFDMPTTMSKFLHLGMPLAQVIRATTLNPARAMRLDGRFGQLMVGRSADVAVLRLEEGSWDLPDVVGEFRTHKRRLVPVEVFKAGQRWRQ